LHQWRKTVADAGVTRNNNGPLYAIIGALLVIVAGGGFYLYKMDRPAALPPVEAAKPAPPAPPPPPVAAPRPTPPPAVPAGPTAAQLNQARNYIAEARRFASAGDFTRAESVLQSADAAVPGFSETAAARREIADMRTPRGQVGPLVTQARRAMERGDFIAADRALDEAERLDANAPAVIDARRDLRAAQRQANQPNNQQDVRVSALLTAARASISRGDYVSADRALDEAERIDPRDPAVRQVRAELAAAQRPRPPRN
jgi:tetratricopeptide (TPR) repeat protein